MNTSSLTGLVVVLAAAVWLGFFVPAWVKRGENVDLVREATRRIKQEAKSMAPVGKAAGKAALRAAKRASRSRSQAQPVAAQRVDYRSLYQAALAVGGVSTAAPVQAAADDRTWTPRHMPAPLHTGHIGTLETAKLAPVTVLQSPATAPVGRPEEVVLGENLDEILRRRRAV